MKKEEKKPIYTLCPRCELNYIDKKEKVCNICKAEMGLLDASILIPDEEEAGIEKLCPICHVNYIGEDEEICFLCEKEKNEKMAKDDSDEWRGFEDAIQDDLAIPDDVEVSLTEIIDEEEAEEEEDDYSAKYAEPDDFDYDVDPNDYLDDEDEDEDEDEDDDDL